MLVASVTPWSRPLILVATLVASGLVGCAEGDPIAFGGGGASGAGGGNGGTTSSNPTTTTGPGCEESPCKLTAPQCGCSDGDACTIDGMGGVVCVQAGGVPAGGACDDVDLCEPGTACIGYGPGQNACATFCTDDSACQGPGGQCVVTLSSQPGVTLCSENCDLTTSSGCPLAGMSCQLGLTDAMVAYTQCAPAGALVDQEICTSNADCAPGYACLPTTANDERCFHWCAVGGAACPIAGDVCAGLEVSMGVPLVIGTTTYGVCNPG